MNKILLFLFLFFYFLNFIFSQDKFVSNFIKIPPFARAVAMGEAFCAISDGTYGLYYNPAALSTILGYEIHFSNIFWLEGINYWYLGLINPDPILDWGKIGLSFSYFKTGRPKNYNNKIIAWDEYIKLPDFLGNYSVNFASALDFTKEFSSGINLKWTYDFTEKVTGSNFSIGLGFIYRLSREFKLGFIFSSNGPKFRLTERGLSLPDTLTAGLSYKFRLFEKEFLWAIQGESELNERTTINSGIEFYLNEFFTLRTGVKYGAFNCITGGLGYKNKNMEINYAYENYEVYGGNTHYLSLILTWGTPSVKFNIVPDIFSPNGDGKFDKIFLLPELRDIDFIKNAKIKFFDKKNDFIGEIIIDDYEKRKIEWDGKLNDRILKDGEYEVQVEAEYIINGSSNSEKMKIIIDTSPPKVNVVGEPKYLKPGQKEALLIPANFYFEAKDKSGINNWGFEIRDEKGNIFFNIKGEGEPPKNILWDGKGNNGEYINTGEFYYYSFYAEDNVGNLAKTKPKYQLVLLKEIKLTYSSDALFDVGKADVKIESYSKLKEIKRILINHPESEIIITGYADEKEINIYKTAEKLALKRAEAIKFFIENMLNITDKKITIFGIKSDLKNDKEIEKNNRKVEVLIKSTIYR